MARASAMVFRRSRLKNARSDGVNVLGANEIAGFTFGEPVEAVAKLFLPPVFEFGAMFAPELLQGCGIKRDSGGIVISRRCNGPDDGTAAGGTAIGTLFCKGRSRRIDTIGVPRRRPHTESSLCTMMQTMERDQQVAVGFAG